MTLVVILKFLPLFRIWLKLAYTVKVLRRTGAHVLLYIHTACKLCFVYEYRVRRLEMIVKTDHVSRDIIRRKPGLW